MAINKRSAKSTVHIEGIEFVANEIKNINNDKIKRREILKILKRQAKPLLRAVKAATPVADKVVRDNGDVYPIGNLRNSMRIKTGRSKEYPNVLVGPKFGKTKKGGEMSSLNDGYYAFFIQYGTKNQAPNDFIGRASEGLLGITDKYMSAELKKYIEKKIKQSKL